MLTKLVRSRRGSIRVAWPKGQGASESGSLLAVPDAARTKHRVIVWWVNNAPN
ncbi:hypothetical protein [Moorena bouillonii]|uniref:hypothetical protein n=1 Tax=Moorena bouillonii TaxID=207920 RepID=UPI0013015F36|nr:hypothetical protein [Moorena bouillonii]NEQ82750.1 hypothetical protein [Moorena sp. SIO2I5]